MGLMQMVEVLAVLHQVLRHINSLKYIVPTQSMGTMSRSSQLSFCFRELVSVPFVDTPRRERTGIL